MTVICVSGAPGSGKSTLARALAASLGVVYASFGDYVRHCAQRRNLGTDRSTLQQLGQALVDAGPREFCSAVLAWIKWQPGAGLILDGLRHNVVFDALTELVRPVPVILVYLDVDRSLQVERLRLRAEESGESWLEDVSEREVPTLLRSRADLLVHGSELLELTVARVSNWSRAPQKRQDASERND